MQSYRVYALHFSTVNQCWMKLKYSIYQVQSTCYLFFRWGKTDNLFMRSTRYIYLSHQINKIIKPYANNKIWNRDCFTFLSCHLLSKCVTYALVYSRYRPQKSFHKSRIERCENKKQPEKYIRWWREKIRRSFIVVNSHIYKM